MKKNSQKETIAIFGFMDSLVGQFLEIFNISNKYEVKYFISVNELPNINIKKEHEKRPNNKTEFIENGKIFKKHVLIENDYINRLNKDKISSVIVLEDNKNSRYEIINNLLAENINVLSFVHETVFLGGQNTIGPGTIIFPMCYVSYKTDLGMGTIIQSNTTLEHHNVIGKCCDINPNVTTGGFTYIGDFSTIHISTTIINRVRIEKNCKIGAGSLVIKDCAEGFLYYGRPATKIKPI